VTRTVQLPVSSLSASGSGTAALSPRRITFLE